MSREPSGAIARRLTTAGILLAFGVLFVWGPGLHAGFALFTALLAGIAAHEYFAMAEHKGLQPESWLGIFAATLTTGSGYWREPYVLGAVFFGSLAISAWMLVLRGQGSFASLQATAFGLLYLGWMPAHIVLVHGMEPVGSGLVTLLIAAVALSDTGAFFAGRSLGRTALAPKISPKKTWEGAVGGLLTALAAMGVIYLLRNVAGWHAFPDWPLWRYLLSGGLLVLAGQVGDLIESLLKRDADVKDSGTFFPGHGGVLDRFDSLLFAAPVLYYLLAV